MPSKKGKNPQVETWLVIEGLLSEKLPHLAAWLGDEESFIDIRIKAQVDGSQLGIVKGYGSDGAPMVLFASGYAFVSVLMGLNAAINGGKWRIDKPWDPEKK